MTDQELIEWAYTKLHQRKDKESGLTIFIKGKLEIIKDQNIIDDLTCKMGVDYITREHISNYKMGLISKLKCCLGCYSMLLADEHPIFIGYFCIDCKANYKNKFHVMEDGVKVHCLICGCTGDMVYCHRKKCTFVYCSTCLYDFCEPGTFQAIQKKNRWFCYICDANNKYKGVLSLNPAWQERVTFLLTNENALGIPTALAEKRPIRVLSIYDGISSGLLFLLKKNIRVDKYFSCEIDPDCINIVKKHNSTLVSLLGDVFNVNESRIKSVIPIDIILIGTPNRDLFSNQKMDDIDYVEMVFLEFFRILRTLQVYNGRNFFWLFNSHGNITVQNSAMVTRFLQRNPAVLDISNTFWKKSTLVWSNLPSFQIDYNSNGELNKKKRMSYNPYNEDIDESFSSSANIEEIENSLGFTRNYTKTIGISNDARLKILKRESGVAFLPAHMECLKNYFETV